MERDVYHNKGQPTQIQSESLGRPVKTLFRTLSGRESSFELNDNKEPSRKTLVLLFTSFSKGYLGMKVIVFTHYFKLPCFKLWMKTNDYKTCLFINQRK